MDGLGPYPFLRKVLARALRYLPPPVTKQAFALAFDPEGKLAANLQYDGPDAFFPVTSVREHPNGNLYFRLARAGEPRPDEAAAVAGRDWAIGAQFSSSSESVTASSGAKTGART